MQEPRISTWIAAGEGQDAGARRRVRDVRTGIARIVHRGALADRASSGTRPSARGIHGTEHSPAHDGPRTDPGDDRRGDGAGRTGRVCASGRSRFPPRWTPKEARESCTPKGRCQIGTIVAESGRKCWDVWLDVHTGEGWLWRPTGAGGRAAAAAAWAGASSYVAGYQAARVHVAGGSGTCSMCYPCGVVRSGV